MGKPTVQESMKVQRARNFFKVITPPLIENGIIGPKPRAAVRESQRENGLVVDGVVGDDTLSALKAALDKLSV